MVLKKYAGCRRKKTRGVAASGRGVSPEKYARCRRKSARGAAEKVRDVSPKKCQQCAPFLARIGSSKTIRLLLHGAVAVPRNIRCGPSLALGLLRCRFRGGSPESSPGRCQGIRRPPWHALHGGSLAGRISGRIFGVCFSELQCCVVWGCVVNVVGIPFLVNFATREARSLGSCNPLEGRPKGAPFPFRP